MSHWASLLLIVYVVLGLGRVSTPKAVRLAVVATTLVVAEVMVRTIAGG